MSELWQLRDLLSLRRGPCTDDCSSMLLGAIVQGMCALGIDSIDSRTAFSPLSVIEQFLEMRSPVVYGERQFEVRASPAIIWYPEVPEGPYDHDFGTLIPKRKKKNKWPHGGFETPSVDPWDVNKGIGHGILQRHECSLERLLGPNLRKAQNQVLGLQLTQFVEFKLDDSDIQSFLSSPTAHACVEDDDE